MATARRRSSAPRAIDSFRCTPYNKKFAGPWEGAIHVVYLKTTFKLEAQARPRVSKAHEHQGGAKSARPAPRQRPTSADGVNFPRGGSRRTRDRLFFMRNSADIERVKKRGSRHHTSLFSIASISSESPEPRVGIIVGRRLGSAVARNRAKRLFRELARLNRSRLARHRAFLVFPKRHALQVSFAELRQGWDAALRRTGLVNPKSSAS